jgi:MFS family permease
MADNLEKPWFGLEILQAAAKRLKQGYPRQFWLLFFGMLISTTGASMIWPFLMIYVSERLQLPLTMAASLMTLNAAAGLVFSFVAGPMTDRLGRKWVMVISLAVNGLGYLFMSRANTLGAFAFLMTLSGAFNPLYRVGADAMMADLVPPERRPDAYSLIRMSNNVGVALGPVIGGLIAASSYTIAFYIAASGMIFYSLLLFIFASETLVRQAGPIDLKRERFGGYAHIWRDTPFMSFTGAVTLTTICASMMWVLLSVYTKENFGLPESKYGLIPMTNALMVVFLQFPVTQVTKRYPSLWMLAAGSFFYAVGVGSVALGNGFPGFWLSMVIMTVGELILVPTATTYVANLAPAEMRGRYMSIYGLTWGVATGIGPVLGGFLNDNMGPITIWMGAFLIGITSTFSFLMLTRKKILQKI